MSSLRPAGNGGREAPSQDVACGKHNGPFQTKGLDCAAQEIVKQTDLEQCHHERHRFRGHDVRGGVKSYMQILSSARADQFRYAREVLSFTSCCNFTSPSLDGLQVVRGFVDDGLVTGWRKPQSQGGDCRQSELLDVTRMQTER